MKNIKKNRKNVISLLNYLKETGIPFTIRLYHVDERFKLIKVESITTDIDNLPMDVIDSDENYIIDVLGNKYGFGLTNNRPYHNTKSFIKKIETELNDMYEEEITNHKRWKVLNDTLNDPNPPSQVPV